MNNALPCNKILAMRKMSSYPMCPRCGYFEETVEHTLLLCESSARVWFAPSFNYKIDLQSISSFDNWFEAFCLIDGLEKNHLSFCLTKISFLLWEIWKSRCNFVFKASSFHPILTATRTEVAACEFLSLNDSEAKIQQPLSPDQINPVIPNPPLHHQFSNLAITTFSIASPQNIRPSILSPHNQIQPSHHDHAFHNSTNPLTMSTDIPDFPLPLCTQNPIIISSNPPSNPCDLSTYNPLRTPSVSHTQNHISNPNTPKLWQPPPPSRLP